MPSHSLAELLRQQDQSLAVAESCTGGLVAKLCTDQAGSSQWFRAGLVTYSNDSKRQLLGVPLALLSSKGAVSIEVAEAMVRGLDNLCLASCGLAITGIAGPAGGSKDKPVGTVCFAWRDHRGNSSSRVVYFQGSRSEIRTQAAEFALAGMVELLLSN